MWIGPQIWFMVRHLTASPLGYQTPVLGDSAPEPGSPESLNVKACHTSASHSLTNLPRIFSTAIPVMHYLCVKCRELLMKVVWRAGMAMVWWLSCNQLRSELKLGLKRGKERGSSKYLAEIVDASEIHCMISAPSQEILKKVIPGDDKCITLFRDWTPSREWSGTLLNSNHLLYFKVECGTMLFLMQSICSGGLKDRRRWIVTCDYCWQVQKGVMWHKS